MSGTENPRHLRPPLQLAVTVASVIAALLLRQILVVRLRLELPPFLTFAPVIMVVALLYGFWPGLIATLLSAVMADYWILPPVGSFAISNLAKGLDLALFCAIGFFWSAVAEGYRRNQRRRQVEEVRESQAEMQRLSEESLRISQEQLAAIIGSAMDAIISTGADQRIVVFNSAAERIFGCSAAEALGAPLDRFIPLASRESHPRLMESFASTGTTTRSMHSPAMFSGLRADGEEFPVEATISTVTVGGQSLNTVILRDISERKRAEQALIRSEGQASVGRMAASIAHEINNPLSAVMNMMFLLQGLEGLPQMAHQYLEMVDEELRRIARITRQSLGFYRESDTASAVSVNAILESAVELMKSKIRQKRAVVEKDLDADVQIIAFAGELRQVFTNLMANSLDAISEGGTIRLRVSAGSDFKSGRRQVRVMIADNGHGIDAATLERIFEPFFTTKGKVGTGLGLWVTKQIIDKHCGTIRVRSCTGGAHRGTVFSVVLPIESAQQDARAPSPIEELAQSAEAHCRPG